ncbi:hypothetical protein GQ42DRAFT_161453 [Ramicandelaber brevisporus]|nr:hypothetical protein GQ42DRAFT_161453 [Ramicandelaber brevisporus]
MASHQQQHQQPGAGRGSFGADAYDRSSLYTRPSASSSSASSSLPPSSTQSLGSGRGVTPQMTDYNRSLGGSHSFQVSAEDFLGDLDYSRSAGRYSSGGSISHVEVSNVGGGGGGSSGMPSLNQWTTAEGWRLMFRYAGVRFLFQALSNPFETAQTLKQVQYVPRSDIRRPPSQQQQQQQQQPISPLEQQTTGQYHDDRQYKLSDYRMLAASHSGRLEHESDVDETASQGGVSVDIQSADEHEEYQLGPLLGGVWKTIGTISAHPDEGYLSLYKGQFTAWVHDISNQIIQPSTEALLGDALRLDDLNDEIFAPSDNSPRALLCRLGHDRAALLTIVASEIITGIALSPLDIARTRLIVQSSHPEHRKYSGLRDALRTISKEEGGMLSIYLHPRNLFPTLLYYTSHSIFDNALPLVLELLGCSFTSARDAPFLYPLAELFWSTLQLVVTMPIDTARKRIMAQPRYRSSLFSGGVSTSSSRSADSIVMDDSGAEIREYETSVVISQLPYTGIFYTIYRIATEEESDARALLAQRLRARQRMAAVNFNSHSATGTPHLARSATGSIYMPRNSIGGSGSTVGGGGRRQSFSSNSEADPVTFLRRAQTMSNGTSSKAVSRSPTNADGWKRLYSGFAMQCLINISLFAVNLVTGTMQIDDDYDHEW